MGHVIVYGAAGFVGSMLLTADQLVGSSITLIDPLPMDPEVLHAARQHGLPIDVQQAGTLSDGDFGEGDALLVLAGQTDVDQALADPSSAFTANGGIAVEVGEWWRRHPDVRVVYLSSDEVLGASDRPLAEDAAYRPTQPYAASKAAAEMTLRCYGETYGLDLVVIRSCNLVGGRQRARKLLPTAVLSLAGNSPVPIFGSGLQSREYLAVEDLCAVLRMAIAAKIPAGVYHCTSAVSLTVIEVVKIVAEAIGAPANLNHVTDRLVHDRAYAMNASLLHSLGWSHRVPPIDAIAGAARELHAAWRRGEKLTTPRFDSQT